jgi:mono/diheme cytochrome c family protein
VLYGRHCAACHGVEGRGDGPLAESLRITPADLTGLAARAGGSFDEATVMSMIDGRRSIAAHGPRQMPVWGVIFEESLRGADAPYPGITGLAQTRAIADYLRTIQGEDSGAPASGAAPDEP